jgi:hypothetical protein
MNQFKIIDDFLDSEQYTQINHILINSGFPWYYQNTVTYDNDCEDGSFFFNHYLYRYGGICSWFTGQVLDPLLNRLDVKTLLRAKVNCYSRQSMRFPHKLHRDMDEDHWVALWSVNDNNGATKLIVDGQEREIMSKANRLILFNGKIQHCAVSHTDQKIRVNININYIPLEV